MIRSGSLRSSQPRQRCWTSRRASGSAAGAERGPHPHDLVPVLGLGVRVAAVQRLRPEQGGRVRLIPGHPARPGRHALPGHLVADRQVGDHRLDRAVRGPHLDPPGEVAGGHAERERPLEPVHQQVLTVRGLDDLLVQPGRAQLLGRARDRVHPHRDAGGQLLEGVLVRLGAQQVLVGGHLRVLAGRLVQPGLDHLGRQGQRRAGRRGAEGQQRGPVPGPAHGRRRRGRVAAQGVAHPQARHLTGGGRDRVADPDADPVRLVHGKREPVPVRGPRRDADRRPGRQ